MNEFIYDIEQLVCGYGSGEDVLFLPSLKIEAGKTYVVLGKSGFGKSTFLETLALMNNTFREGKVIFRPSSSENGKREYNLSKLWQSNKPQYLAQLRCRYFSFIFQQTNLMPNFTMYENIYVTKLMQGASEKECREVTSKILDRVGLSMVDAKRKVTELSGGQKQRVAFARAIISSFDILFGDEPTGNLDEVNSVELLEILKESIQNKNGYHRTAIIVSHSIPLAIKFADKIMVITKSNEKKPAEILPINFFEKTLDQQSKQWKNSSKTFSESEFEKHLKSIF